MPRPEPHAPGRASTYLVPLVAFAALSLPKLGQGGWSTDTPWYAAIALSAFRAAAHGDLSALWSLPGIADQPYFNKPPLAFWLSGPALWALGPTVLAARVGSVIAAALCVLLTTHIARRITRDNLTALVTGLVLALTWEFSRHARSFSLDLWMTAFLLVAALGFVNAAQAASTSSRLRAAAVAGLGVGLALLTKPLIGLVALPLAPFLMLAAAPPSNSHSAWRMRFEITALASLVAMLIGAPWHLSMIALHGDAFTAQYFGREIADRAAASSAAMNREFNRDAGTPLYYLLLLLKGYWPFLATTALGLVAIFADRRRAQADDRLLGAWRLAVVGAIWGVSWIVLLSLFPDRRPRYALVAYPALAMVSGAWLAAFAPGAVRRVVRFAPRLTPVFVLLGLALALLPVRFHRDDPPQWAALDAELSTLAKDAASRLPLYAGALDGQRAGRLYLTRGQWPIAPFDLDGRLVHPPPAGAILLYHRRDGRAPGPTERVLWTRDDLTLTRLEREPWQPVATPDPGE